MTLTALVLAAHYVFDQHNASSRYFQSVLRRLDVVTPDYTTPYDQTKKEGLPEWTEHLTNVWDPLPRSSSKTTRNETPLLWSIPHSGDEAVMQIFSSCLGLTLATKHNLIDDKITNESMNKVRTWTG